MKTIKANSPKMIWNSFTPHERKTIAIYILGIMFYKFGLEAFNGSIVSLATIKFDNLAKAENRAADTFYKVGLLTGLNQATQCVGAILIAPLIKRFPTRTVLSAAILLFGILAAVMLIVDAATGGRFKRDDETANKGAYLGTYNPNSIIPIYTIAGIGYGMVELIRRVIPRDIVGGDVVKLKRMDATVHILYEVAGTAGAFCSTALILRFGNNYSFIITPIFFACAAVTWSFIHHLDWKPAALEDVDRSRGIFGSVLSYVLSVFSGFKLFFLSILRGATLVFSHRRHVWLFGAYAIALHGHRYLENGVAPAFAKRALNNSAYAQIMVGGSNFGELLGALFVFVFTEFIKTPIPWLRLDGLLINIVWFVPFFYPPRTGDNVWAAWAIAGTWIPISFGWAAGDVSLAAYIQASLHKLESADDSVSNLGAVMSFLYSSYIVIYAIVSSQLGTYIDNVTNSGRPVQEALRFTGGVQLTVVGVIVILSTFIPRGAWSLNPQLLENDPLSVSDVESASGPDSQKAAAAAGGADNLDEKDDDVFLERKDEASEPKGSDIAPHLLA